MITTERITTGQVRLKPIALPIEHGGWSLLLEPIVLGLLLAPSLGGLLLSLAAVAAFLTRHPLKLAVGDRFRNRRTVRTPLAERFAALYLVISAVFLGAAILTTDTAFWLPLLLAVPIVFVQLFFDSRGQSRALVAELAGSLATGTLAMAIAICGGWPPSTAVALWVIIAARNVPTILYLRARLRLLHRKPTSTRLVYIAHILAVATVILPVRFGIAPWLSVAAISLLLLRAVLGFAESGKRTTAKMLGVRELIFGVLTVFAVVIGYRIGW